MERRRKVRVPASSANLGPGFDCFAAALDLHVEVEVIETGTFGVVTDLDIETGRDNLVGRGFAALADPEQFEFRISSNVPLSGGLGSSAAATVAGVLAADHIFELDSDVLSIAAAIEGHPDNVAASLLGGFVICADESAVRIPMPSELEAVMVVPAEAVRTSDARAALSVDVPLSQAVFNISHAGMLVAGLTTSDLSLISRGLADELHQDRRYHLFPRSHELLGKVRDFGALGATISGAGPTVLIWTHMEETGRVMERLAPEVDGWAQALRVPFAPEGADVVSL
ncbi:MAG TPA: homoserine kinase [Baekduia sp.]|nr:homoserine kinase [Baekduia sp.]